MHSEQAIPPGLMASASRMELTMISEKKIYRSVGFCTDPPGQDPIVKTPVTVRRITDVG
jgi:hypothetical protein